MFSVLRSTSQKIFFDDVVFHDSVDLDTFIPWFLCQIIEHDEIHDCSFSTVKLVTSINSLMSICHYYQIEQIYLVSPNYLNKSDEWRIDKLHSILIASFSNEDGEFDAYKFVLAAGGYFVHQNVGVENIENQVNFKLLIDFESLKIKSTNANLSR
ncbi:hypothetical protein [Methylophilus sp.]|uniref:hypothetical protein n=1 Tax=Methylophilus sp. TaxID=29541 RepID=UPI000D4D1868|nr:hypothetical protein [Methylophilus sp.]PPD12198.1 MAG: hypothetical protein CTY26_06325 [Methylophilus sp.]